MYLIVILLAIIIFLILPVRLVIMSNQVERSAKNVRQTEQSASLDDDCPMQNINLSEANSFGNREWKRKNAWLRVVPGSKEYEAALRADDPEGLRNHKIKPFRDYRML